MYSQAGNSPETEVGIALTEESRLLLETLLPGVASLGRQLRGGLWAVGSVANFCDVRFVLYIRRCCKVVGVGLPRRGIPLIVLYGRYID